MEAFDVIVIGQGYAGLTAAKLAAERGLRTANCESYNLGGLILNINELDPAVPGEDASGGADLASNLVMNNSELGVVSVNEAVTALEHGEDGGWLVRTGSENYAARHVIVASGARLKKLGAPGEEEFFGRGVSECADCDGPMFIGQEAVVVGGGDSAFQEALKLAEYASKVTIVMRGAAPRARADLRAHADANEKVVQLTNAHVTEILGAGDKGVEGVTLRLAHGEETLPCTGVFIFVGLQPNTDFLPPEITRDGTGALVTNDQCATSLEGVWAIGAARSGFPGMLTDAAADASRVIAAVV